MDIKNHLIAEYDRALFEYQQAYIRRAPLEEQERLLREWSAAYRRLLFLQDHEDSCLFDL